MVKGGSGLCRTTQVKFIVLSLFMYISGSPMIIVTGSVDDNEKTYMTEVMLKNRIIPLLKKKFDPILRVNVILI